MDSSVAGGTAEDDDIRAKLAVQADAVFLSIHPIHRKPYVRLVVVDLILCVSSSVNGCEPWWQSNWLPRLWTTFFVNTTRIYAPTDWLVGARRLPK